MSAPPESPSVQHRPRPWPERPVADSGRPGQAPYPAAARRTSRTAVLGLVLALLLPLVGLVLLLVSGGTAGEASSDPVALAPAADGERPGADTAAEQPGAGPVAQQPTTGAEPGAESPADDEQSDKSALTDRGPADRPELPALTPEAWAQVVGDPDAHRGDEVSVYAEVFRADAEAGALLVNAGTSQPAGELELGDAAFVLAPAYRLTELAEGDVVRVDAVVDGSRAYDTVQGVENTVVALRAVALERVGYLDLTQDVSVGAPWPERFGGVEVPLTVVNSGDTTYNFDVTVTAASPDGRTTYATTSTYVDDLTPGQTGQDVASFLEPVPADAVYSVTAVKRYAA